MKNAVRWQYAENGVCKYVWCWDEDTGREKRVHCDKDGWVDGKEIYNIEFEDNISQEMLVMKDGDINIAKRIVGVECWEFGSAARVTSVDYFQPLPRAKL